MTTMPAVYLAGPAVFHPAYKHLFDYLKDVCAKHGLAGVAPVDGAVELADMEPHLKAAAIRQGNIEKLKSCRAVIACISPFRGPGADPGTTWEMGYAEALGKPVVAWSEETRPYLSRVAHDRDDDGRIFCLQHGMQVEDFGLVENLMLAGGEHPVQPDFDSAVRLTAKMLGVTSNSAD